MIAHTTYFDGLEHGPQWEWHPDGSKKLEGQCNMGNAIGEWREWHLNGELAEYTLFDRWGDLRCRTRWANDGRQLQNEISQGAHGGKW